MMFRASFWNGSTPTCPRAKAAMFTYKTDTHVKLKKNKETVRITQAPRVSIKQKKQRE